MTQLCGRHHGEMLIIALTTILFLNFGNPQLSKWRLSKDTKIMEPCLSYVSEMNVNNRHTVAVLVNSDASELYNNAFIRRIINSTNLLIISNKDQMPGAATKAAMMAKNFTLNKFHHGLGRVMIFFLEISSLSSLHDKLWFIARLTSVFDSRGCFIVWHHNDFKDAKTREKIDGNERRNNASQYLGSFLQKAFSILWKFYIFNAIIVTCQYGSIEDANDPDDATSPNCPIFTWFPYHKASRCGENTQNFVEVDRCEFVPNDNGGAFYVNYLNSSRRQIYDNSESLATTSNDSRLPVPVESQTNDNGNDGCNQKSCRNLYYMHNYFKWEPHGILEFRKISRKNDSQSAEDPNTMANADEGILKIQAISPEFRHFFNKIPSDLNGCQFRTVLFIWPPFVTPPSVSWIGIEHKLLLDVSRLMNFHLKEFYVKNEAHPSNDLPSDVVESFNADLAFGNLYPSIERYQLMDHSIGYFYDHINWVVPLAGDQPVWLNLIHCFGPEIWVLVVVVAATFIPLYTRICQLIGNKSFSASVLDCVMIALGASQYSLPRNGTVRFILVTWIIYCFHINLMYQVQLVSVLTRPIAEKQISTPSELKNSKLPFGFTKNFEVHLKRINDSESRYFIANNQECSFETCITEMHRKSFATIGNRMYVQYVIAFEKQNTKIFTFREPIAKSFVEVYMTKGFPLRDKLNFLLRRMVEIGYLSGSQSFYKMFVRNVSIDNSIRFRKREFLTLEHFAGAFIVLAIGAIAGTLSFCGEVWIRKHRKVRK